MTTTKTKQQTTKKKATKKASSKKKAPAKAAPQPQAARAGSMAEFLDELVQREADPKKLRDALAQEVARRGLKTPATIATIRAHVRFRQARGQLTGVSLPEHPHA